MNTQSARHSPSTVVRISLYLFIALASLAWLVLYAQVGATGSFCVAVVPGMQPPPQTLNITTTY